ncbi:MAG: carboxypeptidase regulatory-like domain-containing protein [Haliscomenobacter sp.]|nr:carboxypeptidase regulatory-like domain-containing protein [Haliscomenobacter sp.]
MLSPTCWKKRPAKRHHRRRRKYEIAGLAPGLYDLVVSFVGYDEVAIYEIQVSNAKPAIVDVQMEKRPSNCRKW